MARQIIVMRSRSESQRWSTSPDGQRKLENWRNQETPCCVGRVNGVEVIALRGTGSTTCVVETDLLSQSR